MEPGRPRFLAGVSAQQVRNLEVGRTSRPHKATVVALDRALLAGERRKTTRTETRETGKER